MVEDAADAVVNALDVEPVVVTADVAGDGGGGGGGVVVNVYIYCCYYCLR